MRIGSYRVHAEWGHLAFVLALAAFCAWYWFDARAASTSIQNLLIIQPVAIFALLLCAAIAVRLVRIERAGEMPEKRMRRAALLRALRDSGELRGALFAVLLGAYVAGMPFAGFDLATFVFLAAGMFLLGERRPAVLAGFSGLLALALSYGFKVMLSVPVPTVVF